MLLLFILLSSTTAKLSFLRNGKQELIMENPVFLYDGFPRQTISIKGTIIEAGEDCSDQGLNSLNSLLPRIIVSRNTACTKEKLASFPSDIILFILPLIPLDRKLIDEMRDLFIKQPVLLLPNEKLELIVANSTIILEPHSVQKTETNVAQIALLSLFSAAFLFIVIFAIYYIFRIRKRSIKLQIPTAISSNSSKRTSLGWFPEPKTKRIVTDMFSDVEARLEEQIKSSRELQASKISNQLSFKSNHISSYISRNSNIDAFPSKDTVHTSRPLNNDWVLQDDVWIPRSEMEVDIDIPVQFPVPAITADDLDGGRRRSSSQPVQVDAKPNLNSGGLYVVRRKTESERYSIGRVW